MSKFLLGAIFGATCWTVVLYYTLLLEQSKVSGEIDIKNSDTAKTMIDRAILEQMSKAGYEISKKED